MTHPVIQQRVTVGQTVTVIIPKNEATQNLGISEEMREILIEADGVRHIIREGDNVVLAIRVGVGNPHPSQLTYEEAGVIRDGDALYVEDLPVTLAQIYRGGKPVSPRMLPDSFAILRWFNRHTNQTMDWALQYEGYEVRTHTVNPS